MSNITGKTDEELVYLMSDDSLEAFNEIYYRYWNPLLAKAMDRLKSKEDAEEVIQELFVTLWLRRARLQLQFTFRTYIYAALKYQLLHQVAQTQVRKNDVTIENSHLTQFLMQDDTFYSVEIKELQMQIESQIENLPDKCRLIFRMSRNEGKSAKEIARDLNISARTVETQIGKALRILKKSLYFLVFL